MPSLKTIIRWVTCSRSDYAADNTQPPLKTTTLHTDTVHPSKMTCIFEPRIDVLEKRVEDMNNLVQQYHTDVSVESAKAAQDTERIMQLLETLREQHCLLVKTVNEMHSQSNKTNHMEDASNDAHERPTLIVPSDIVRHTKEQVEETRPVSKSIDIPINPTTVASSPTWYPVSADAHESTVYHDAYSSEEDDMTMNNTDGPVMVDA